MRKGYWARLMRLAPIVLLAFCLLFAGCETNVAEMSSLPELSRPYAGEYECETLTLAGEDMLSAFRTVRLTLGYDGNIKEIADSVQFLSLVTGEAVTLFAPPSGAYDEDTVSAAEALGLKTILWSKDTIDWRDKDADTCFLRATKDVTAGDFILMHPMTHTLEALPRILETYEKQGLRAVTVSENLSVQTAT